MKPNLFIDISILTQIKGNFTGISRVIYNITKNIILHHPNFQPQFLVFSTETSQYYILSYDDFLDLVQKINVNDNLCFRQHLQTLSAAKTFCSNDWIFLLGEQWLFPAAMDHILAIKKQHQVRVLSIIYDLVPFITSQYHWDGFCDDFKKSLLKTIALSDTILSISQSTQNDLLSICKKSGIDPSFKKKIIRLGDSFLSQQKNKENNISNYSPFILSVGTLQPRKNHLLLIYVWKLLIQSLAENTPDLILVGNMGWHMQDLLYFLQNDPELSKKIIIKTESNDTELISLYKNCLFTLYPSFYEGWGLPVAESCALGKFCISSDTSSLTEIAGSLLDYHNPYDSGELCKKIMHYLANPLALKQRELAISKNYKLTNWENTTQQIIDSLSL